MFLPLPKQVASHPIAAFLKSRRVTSLTEKQKINRKLGFATAIAAQVLWGGFPLYIRLFKGIVDPVDFVAHRAVWSFAVLAIWLSFFARRSQQGEPRILNRLFSNLRTVTTAIFATVMIAINWLVFVWAVSNDYAVDASLGYYICPQIVVLLGVIFLRERLSPIQWTAVGVAAVGVLIMTGSGQGRPEIGLLVAAAFGVYALIKKKTHLSAPEGLCLETGFMLIPAVAFLVWRSTVGATIFPESTLLTLALLCCGFATVAPLLLYAIAVKHLSLSTMGLLQFIGPTMQFLIGVFVFTEAVDITRLTGFVFVWIGVSTYLYGLHRRANRAATGS